LLLQGGFLLLFLASMPQIAPLAPAGRELVFTLPRVPQAQPLAIAPQTRARTQPPPVAPAAGPSLQIPSPAVAPSSVSPNLKEFGQALNGCAPEGYRNLTDEQKARCIRPSAGVAIQEAPNLLGSPDHVKDEAHWAVELARKKSPLWLPCTGTGVGIDFICLVTKIADGSLTDPHTWPIYETQQLAPNELYKIEQTYDQWNKDHRDARQTASPSDAAVSAPQPAHSVR
jgi:hypothetical protein